MALLARLFGKNRNSTTFLGLFKRTARDWFEEARRMAAGFAQEGAQAFLRDVRMRQGLPGGEWEQLRSRSRNQVARCLKKAVRIDPSFAPAWLALGEETLYGEEPDLEKAIACFDRALSLDARLADAYYLKATASERMGAYSVALVCFEETVRLNPRDGEAWMGESHLLRRQGDEERAAVCADKGKAFYDTSPSGFHHVFKRWPRIQLP